MKRLNICYFFLFIMACGACSSDKNQGKPIPVGEEVLLAVGLDIPEGELLTRFREPGDTRDVLDDNLPPSVYPYDHVYLIADDPFVEGDRQALKCMIEDVDENNVAYVPVMSGLEVKDGVTYIYMRNENGKVYMRAGQRFMFSSKADTYIEARQIDDSDYGHLYTLSKSVDEDDNPIHIEFGDYLFRSDDLTVTISQDYKIYIAGHAYGAGAEGKMNVQLFRCLSVLTARLLVQLPGGGNDISDIPNGEHYWEEIMGSSPDEWEVEIYLGNYPICYDLSTKKSENGITYYGFRCDSDERRVLALTEEPLALGIYSGHLYDGDSPGDGLAFELYGVSNKSYPYISAGDFNGMSLYYKFIGPGGISKVLKVDMKFVAPSNEHRIVTVVVGVDEIYNEFFGTPSGRSTRSSVAKEMMEIPFEVYSESNPLLKTKFSIPR